MAACTATPEVSDTETPKATDIRALQWLAAGHDPVLFLTTRPVECRTRSNDLRIEIPTELGRLAFESPALLGGAAGRMELACSSCHLSGQDNPDFFLAGVSMKAGTADVTSGLFSKVRGDETFNPLPIPNVTLRDGKRIKDRKGEEFREKIRGLIVEEFDGQPPPKYVFEMLILYMDSLDPAVCDDPLSREPITAGSDLDAVIKSLAQAHAVSDRAEQVFWLRTSRLRLARLHERFVGADLANVRQSIESLSRLIGAEQTAIQEGRLGPDYADFNWEAFAGRILADEKASLYNPDVLRAALAQ